MEPEDKIFQHILDFEVELDIEEASFDFDHFDEHMEPYDLERTDRTY